MGQLFAPRAFGSKKCVVRTFVVRPDGHSFIHSCFSFSSAEASRNLGFLRGKTNKQKKTSYVGIEPRLSICSRNARALLAGIHSRARYPDGIEAMACMWALNK